MMALLLITDSYSMIIMRNLRSAVHLKTGPVCYKEWQRSAEIAGTRAVVKFTVPGPMTLMDGMVNIFYEDETRLAEDLVTCINEELRGLAGAGCTHVQIDEPVMMR